MNGPVVRRGWQMRRAKTVVSLVDEKTPVVDPGSFYIGLENVESWTGRLLQADAPAEPESTVNRFKAGDILFGKLRPYLAKVVETNVDGVCSTEFFVLRARPNASHRFLRYALTNPAFIDDVNAWTYGVKMPRANWARFGNLSLAVPDFESQLKIADFLDRETTEADELIAEYELLLELLEERRVALITQAVTKGLDPTVSMKCSGVEWIGDIPSHWAMWKMSRAVANIGSGTTPPSDRLEWYGGGIPFVTTAELREAVISETNDTVFEEAVTAFSSLKLHPTGSIVVAMYGATIGRLGILGVPATVNQACCVIQGSKTLSAPYLYQWLLAKRREIVSLAMGGGQPNISQETIRTLRVPTPPIDEQAQIVSFISGKIRPLEALRVLTERAMALARDRRKALITAAVNGEIDVTTYKANIASEVA